MSKLMSKQEQTTSESAVNNLPTVPSTSKKKQRNRSTHQGGYMRIKGKLYARIQYYDESGRRKSKTRRIESGKITDVWIEVKKMRDELDQHGEETLNADKMTFADVAEKYKTDKVHPAIIKDGHKIAGLKSYKPVETYVKIAIEYFGKRLLRTIKARDIENFKKARLQTPVEIEIKKREKKLNDATKRMKYLVTKETRITPRKLSSVHRELATLRRIFNYAVLQGWLTANPFEKTERMVSNASEKARERVLTYEEENRLLSECRDEREHLKPILICALDTAMRPEEIYKLVWSDIDFQNGVIIIRAENTKTETERIIGITPRLQKELERLWELSPKDLDFSVFGVKSIKTAFKTACRNTEIKNFRFRDCRHTATTRMVNSGIPQAEIMKVTGHTQLKTFLRYVNLTAESASESAMYFGEFVSQKLAGE